MATTMIAANAYKKSMCQVAALQVYYYNKLDLPIMVRDDNERQTITKYDILKRPIMTGEYNGASSPATNGATQEYEEIDPLQPHGYSLDKSFPANANQIELHSITYYDAYKENYCL